MSFMCSIGIHRWSGCKCAVCNKTRDEGHEWSGCECSVCTTTRNGGHEWKETNFRDPDDQFEIRDEVVYLRTLYKCSRCGKEKMEEMATGAKRS